MSNDYGLVVNNASGDIMFDSRRQMDSYVVASYGNALGVNGNISDLVFIKGDVSVKDKLVFVERYAITGGTAYTFQTFDPTTRTKTPVALDYIHVRPSGMITPPAGEDYGLMIKNPDGTVQFDSRSIQTDAHFSITKVWRRLDLYGNGLGSALTTSSGQYIEVGRTTSVSVIINVALSAIEFSGSTGNVAKYVSYVETGIGTVVTNYRDLQTAMFIAELDT